MPDVTLREVAGVPVAIIRRHVRPDELARVVPEGCGKVWTTLRAQQIQGGRNVAIYLDGDIHLEVGVEATAEFVERDGVVHSSTPAGLTAHAVHLGPYGELGHTYAAIRDWCRARGHRLAGPRWEVYGHWQPEWNEAPEAIRTDVFCLIAPDAPPKNVE